MKTLMLSFIAFFINVYNSHAQSFTLGQVDSLIELRTKEKFDKIGKDFKILLDNSGKKENALSQKEFEVVYNNLGYMSKIYSDLNDGVNSLIALNELSKRQENVADLYNVTKSTIGFSFIDEMKNLATTTFKKRTFAAKLCKLIEGLSKSKIITGIPYAPSAFNIANTTIGILRGAGVVKDEIPDHEKISDFENGLSKYTKYYELLSDSSTGNLNVIKYNRDKLYILQKKIYNETKFIAKQMNYPTMPNDTMKTPNYIGALLNGFNENYVHNFLNNINNIEKLENQYYYKNNCKTIIAEINNNRLDILNKLVTEYLLIFDDYIKYINDDDKIKIKAIDYAIDNILVGEEAKRKAQTVKSQFNSINLIQSITVVSKKSYIEGNNNLIVYKYFIL